MSDCEPVRPDGVAQPVSTATAAAYLLAGGWLVRRAARAACPPLARAYGLAVAALGAGSVAYHAGGGTAARWAHDVTLALPGAVVLGGTVVALVRGGRGWWHRGAGPARIRALALGAGALVLAAPFQLLGRTGGPLCRGGDIPAHGVWHVMTALALAAAGIGLVEPLEVRAQPTAEPDTGARP